MKLYLIFCAITHLFNPYLSACFYNRWNIIWMVIQFLAILGLVPLFLLIYGAPSAERMSGVKATFIFSCIAAVNALFAYIFFCK